MKKVLIVFVIVALMVAISEKSFSQMAKGRPSNSSVATTTKVKSKKKVKKTKGVKRVRKNSKRKKTGAIPKISNKNYVSLRKKEKYL